jgi:glycosyltransferase 2 family protein
MTEPTHEIKKSQNWRSMLPGILISVLALFLLFRFFDWQEVLLALRQAEWIYLLIALPVYLISYVFRAMAWRTILKNEVPFRKVFLTMFVGYTLNNILPFRLGELGRAYFLGREDKLSFWQVFSSILIERAFDMILAVGLLMSTLPFVLKADNTRQLALIVGAVVMLGLLMLYLLARNRQWALDQFERLAVRWPLITRLGKDRLDAFLQGLSALTSLKRFLTVFVLMGISWSLALSIQFLVLRSFYSQARLLHAAFSLGVSSLGVAIPSSPGYIGVFEAAVVGALALFEIPFSIAFANAVTLHILYVLMTGSFGVYTLASSNISLGEIFQRVRGLNPQR